METEGGEKDIPEYVLVVESLKDKPVLFQCKTCSKTFKTKANIKYHAFCQEGTDKPFKCDQCGKGFVSKSHYEYHMRNHAGLRPFKCPECGKGFNQQAKVTRHLKCHSRRVSESEDDSEDDEDEPGENEAENVLLGDGRHEDSVTNNSLVEFLTPGPFLSTHFLVIEEEQTEHQPCEQVSFNIEEELNKITATIKAEAEKRDEPWETTVSSSVPARAPRNQKLPKYIKRHKEGQGVYTFECKKCSKKFKTKAHFKYHEFCGDGNDKPFKCDICGQGFISKSHFQYHHRTHTGERPYVCSVCGKGFNQRSKVTRHLKTHKWASDEEFAIAAEQYTNSAKSKKETLYDCPECERSFDRKLLLLQHVNTHTKSQRFPCSVCPATFTAAKDARRHEVSHSGVKAFSCPHCERAFSRKDHLARHVRRVHESVEPPSEEEDAELNLISCDLCEFASNCPDELKTHIRNDHPLHSPTSSFETETTEVSSMDIKPDIALLEPSILAEEDVDDNSSTTEQLNLSDAIILLNCALCGFTTASPAEYHLHTKTVHPKTITPKQPYVRPTKSVYKPFPCEQCVKAFTNAKDLRRHQLIHTGDRAYKCDLCHVDFARKDNLSRHIRNVHTCS